MVDEWSGFAALLANWIEKYAVVMNLDALPDLVIEEAVPEKDTNGIISQEKGIFINRHRNVLSFSLGVIF